VAPVILASRHLALFTYDLYESRPLEVLGIISYEDKTPQNANIPTSRLKLRASIDAMSPIPKITFLDKSKIETQVILFSPPNPHEMQFFSLTPITLDLAASDREQGRRRADSVVIDERDESETARMELLVQKMGLHFPRKKGQPTQGAAVLPSSIDQVFPLASMLTLDKQYMGTF
jgi:phosphatidylinositol N-acetylglucosaminyltransferase subunit Q